MRHIVFFLISLALISCENNKEEQIIKYLTNGSEKHWVFVKEHPIKWYSGRSYNINGTYTAYSISEGIRTKIDLYQKPTWQLKTDSIIVDGQDIKFKIIYLNDDILVLNNLASRGILVALKSPDQITKPIPDTSDHSMDL